MKKPCPNCGHCPTCGKTNYPRVGRWPYYPTSPYPYWSVIPPYRTGDFWQTTTTPNTSVSASVVGNTA